VKPSARFIIAGGASIFTHAEYRRAFEARRAELGPAVQGVEIAGVLSDERITALLQAADALVFPSLVEGFGLVVLEALACGTPVVTSAIPPFTEYLHHSDALLVDPRNPRAIAAAMLRACEPDVASRLGARGRELALRFGWDAAARVQVAAYAAHGAAELEAVRA
jgi:glycosyltransferase involved in cell wall biosynthesis